MAVERAYDYKLVDVQATDHDARLTENPKMLHNIATTGIAKGVTEEGRVAIEKDVGVAIASSLLHFIPVIISGSILQLSFQNIFWRGTDYTPTQTGEILAAFQIAAKVHEILITTSLSVIVLHYLRKLLYSPDGIPFGLLTTAYHVVLGSQPLSRDLWYSSKAALSDRKSLQRYVGLIGLLLLASALGLAVGPASATAMIPKLRWWYFRDLFVLEGPLPGKKVDEASHVNDLFYDSYYDFEMYIPQPLFPATVNSTSLPGDFCMSSVMDKNSTCPYAGLSQILENLMYTNKTTENFTIDAITGRKFSSNSQLEDHWSWTSSQVLSSYLATGVNSISLSDEKGPWTLESQSETRGTMNPAVKSSCITRNSTSYNVSLGFGMRDPITDDYYHLPYFDIRDIWNTSVLANASSMMVEWRDLQIDPTWPVLTTFIYTPEDENGVANVSVCQTTAFLYPVKTWITSSEGLNIISNFSWDFIDKLESYMSYRQKAKPAGIDGPIHIQEDWANTFNADNINSSSTIIIDYLKSGTQKYRQDGVGKVDLNYYATNPYPLTPYGLLLSRAIADGLARIGSAYRLTEIENPQVIACRKSWCSSGLLDVGAHQIFNTSLYYAFGHFSSQGIRGNTDIPAYNGTGALDPLLKSYVKPANTDEIWTKISFPIKRYGYGWGYRSATFLVAAAVLILEALVVFVHIIRLFCTRWSYQHVDSLAEILDVALKSESLSTAKADTEEFWARSTSVMGSHDPATSTSSLRLVVRDKRDGSLKGSQLEDLVLGKKYV